MEMICANCEKSISKSEICKYENSNFCLNCFIFLNGINCKGDLLDKLSEDTIVKNIINNINYRNNYFHFYYKFEDEFKYNKRIFKFNKINLQEMYNRGWYFLKSPTKSSTVLIYRTDSFITFVSISCVYIFLREDRYVLKLYDFVEMNSDKYLNHFGQSKVLSLKPILPLYAE